MTRCEVETAAEPFGGVEFEERVAKNTGGVMVCGYVVQLLLGRRVLFAKAQSSDPGDFRLCNEFLALGKK